MARVHRSLRVETSPLFSCRKLSRPYLSFFWSTALSSSPIPLPLLPLSSPPSPPLLLSSPQSIRHVSFSSLNTSQAKPPTLSLGTSAPSQPAAGGLFGSLSTSTNPTAATGGLFGAASTTATSQPPAQTGSGLFSGIGAASQPQQPQQQQSQFSGFGGSTLVGGSTVACTHISIAAPTLFSNT